MYLIYTLLGKCSLHRIESNQLTRPLLISDFCGEAGVESWYSTGRDFGEVLVEILVDGEAGSGGFGVVLVVILIARESW